jgi:hypothetical protein
VAEKSTHKRTVAREAGPKGHKEVPVRGGRLDAATQRRAIEVETSGSPARLRHATQKLKASGRPQHVLVVPERDMPKATEAMRRARVTGTVRNLSGTRSQRVAAPKAPPSRQPKTGRSSKARRTR